MRKIPICHMTDSSVGIEWLIDVNV